jgi:hypothetical protein
MAKKFRDLIATKAPSWHAAVAARKRQLYSEEPDADRPLDEESTRRLPGEKHNPDWGRPETSCMF